MFIKKRFFYYATPACIFILSFNCLYASAGSANDDYITYGAIILFLGFILGISYLISFIRGKINKHNKTNNDQDVNIVSDDIDHPET